jgi:hypothetical protein
MSGTARRRMLPSRNHAKLPIGVGHTARGLRRLTGPRGAPRRLHESAWLHLIRDGSMSDDARHVRLDDHRPRRRSAPRRSRSVTHQPEANLQTHHAKPDIKPIAVPSLMTWVTDLAREVGDTSGQTAVLVEVSPVSGRSGKCVFVQPGMLYAAHLSKAPARSRPSWPCRRLGCGQR